jgi:carbamoyltransferase
MVRASRICYRIAARLDLPSEHDRPMPQLILGIHPGIHDASAALYSDYDLLAAVQLERLTRVKSDGREFPDTCIDEVLSIAGCTRRDLDVVAISRMAVPVEHFTHFRGLRWLREQYRTRIEGYRRRMFARELRRANTLEAEAIYDLAGFRRGLGVRADTEIFFFNHHEAHALPALFHTDWDDALLVTADAGGDNIDYSYTHFAGGRLTTIYGGDGLLLGPTPIDSLGRLYGAATDALGFKSLRHEGKVTGLSAMGSPRFFDEIARHFTIAEDGRIAADFVKHDHMWPFMRAIAAKASREDVAASVQEVLEDFMLESVRRMLARHPARHLGVAGGIFANVKLNRVLAERLPIEEIFVVPPMGDEGMSTGGPLCHLLRRDGLERWLNARRRLEHVYLGRDYTAAIDAALERTPGISKSGEAAVEGAAERLARGEIGAIYTGRMEFGPRALGARSILANPARRETHDLLNERLARSEFMPFAPVVSSGRAAEVFDVNPKNAYACRFMTITCDVRPAWRQRIPAVVHVDGSARPQVIERASNPLYFDVLSAFERRTGLPVLVNTSFNVHEEPIVNRPEECTKALADGRIDFVVTEKAIYRRK